MRIIKSILSKCYQWLKDFDETMNRRKPPTESLLYKQMVEANRVMVKAMSRVGGKVSCCKICNNSYYTKRCPSHDNEYHRKQRYMNYIVNIMNLKPTDTLWNSYTGLQACEEWKGFKHEK